MRKKTRNKILIYSSIIVIVVALIIFLKPFGFLLSVIDTESDFTDLGTFTEGNSSCLFDGDSATSRTCTNGIFTWYQNPCMDDIHHAGLPACDVPSSWQQPHPLRYCGSTLTNTVCTANLYTEGTTVSKIDFRDNSIWFDTQTGSAPNSGNAARGSAFSGNYITFTSTENLYGTDVIIETTPDSDYLGIDAKDAVQVWGHHIVVPNAGIDVLIPNKVTNFKFLFDSDNPNNGLFYIGDVLKKNFTLTTNEFHPQIVIIGASVFCYESNACYWSTNNNYYIRDIGHIQVTKFKIRKPCTDNFQVDEVFRGPQNIDIHSLRFDNPKFCPQLQSLKLTSSGIQKDANINTVLSSNNLVAIKDGEAIKVQYFIPYADQIAIDCNDSNKFFQYCRDGKGFLHVCSEGVWNSADGTCAVNVDSPSFCQRKVDNTSYKGIIYGRYDVDSKSCFYIQPQGDVCILGTYNGNGKCIWKPDCVKYGGDFNPVRGECCGSEIPSYNPITNQCEEFAHSSSSSSVSSSSSSVSSSSSSVSSSSSSSSSSSKISYSTEKFTIPSFQSVSGPNYLLYGFIFLLIFVVSFLAYQIFKKK